MNELLQILLQVLQDVEASFDELTDQEAEAISQVLTQATDVLIQSFQPSPPEMTLQTPMPMGTDLLWILSGREPQVFLSYLRSYPGEGLKELAANPTRFAQVVADLEKRDPFVPPSEGPDGILEPTLQSSNVAGMKYDPKSKRLLVKFHGNQEEPVYEYSDVPPQIFNVLWHGNAFAKTKGRNRFGAWWPMKNPSLGAAVDQYLKKGGFAYQRVR